MSKIHPPSRDLDDPARPCRWLEDPSVQCCTKDGCFEDQPCPVHGKGGRTHKRLSEHVVRTIEAHEGLPNTPGVAR